jgi:hypothetical protein
MKLNDTARLLIGSTPATLVTVNRDGSPQVSVVWPSWLHRERHPVVLTRVAFVVSGADA